VSTQVWLAIFTAVSTVLAILCTVACLRAQRELRRTVHALRKQHATYELMCEEFEAIKKRQTKLAGRFFRGLKPDGPMVVDGGAFENELPPAPPPRDDRTQDFVNGGADSEIEAMLALQRSHTQP